MDVDQPLSPSFLEKVSYLGTLLRSFRQGETAITKLLELSLGQKRIERITERIGAERVAQVEQEVADFRALTLTQKLTGPPGVSPPKSAAVMADGGRFQRTKKNPDATSDKKSHWFEYKAGLCLVLGSRADDVQPGPEAVDPCPHVPAFLMNLEQVETLTREMASMAAGIDEEPLEEGSIGLDPVEDLAALKAIVETAQRGRESSRAASARELPLSPKLRSRDLVATREKRPQFGLKLAARAWSLGLFQAEFKAFVGDGSSWVWTVFEDHFKPFGFTAVVDIIHAVTHLYSAATAGRSTSKGGAVYCRWMPWLWSGELTKVIAALATRQAELGTPGKDEPATSPRRIVNESLTYFQNQQSRMQYPEYRKLGLPITSSHMESAIKELNYRIKGSEKFWSAEGSESLLQLKADTLSCGEPLDAFWKNRRTNRTGLHGGAGKRKRPKAAVAPVSD